MNWIEQQYLAHSNSTVHSFIKTIFIVPLQVHTTQRRSRHSTDTVPEFHAEAPQAIVSQGLAQGSYVAASGVNLVWNPGGQFFHANFQKISTFPGRFRFFQANWQKISIFPGKLTKNFDYYQAKLSEWPFLVIYSKMSIYPDNICHLQLNSRQIILFRLKSHHFRTYFLNMISYNNVSQLVHDPPAIPQPKIWGSWHPNPPGLTPMVAARVGVEPMTLRTKGVDSTNAPHTPHVAVW